MCRISLSYLLKQLDHRLAATVHDIHLTSPVAGVVVDTVGHSPILAVDRASMAVEHQGFHPNSVNLLILDGISRASKSIQVRRERLDPRDGHVFLTR